MGIEVRGGGCVVGVVGCGGGGDRSGTRQQAVARRRIEGGRQALVRARQVRCQPLAVFVRRRCLGPDR